VVQVDGRARGDTTARVVGRDRELAAVVQFLDSAGAGPGALVLEGEAGIGKTILWQAGLDAARERLYRVLVSRPAEAEAKLGYAALGDLLAAVPDELLADLAEPQRRALEIALLRLDPGGSRAQPQAVAVAVLNVLRALARVGPLLVAIDDVQWLDAASARALEFAFRRLDDEPVGVLASERSGGGKSPLRPERLLAEERFDRVIVGPLASPDLDAILSERLASSFSRHTRARIHDLSGGNPFYALEIARSLETTNERVVTVPPRLRALVRARIDALPKSTRRALLAASALSAPSHSLVAAATGRRDGRAPALEKAEAAAVIELEGELVRFTHPLLAATVYGDADSVERRRVHRRLARIVPQQEESARHLALATAGPDERVAAALEAAARSASARGAAVEATDLAELAWQTTPPRLEDERFRRQFDAASYHLIAGDHARMCELAVDVVSLSPPGAVRAEALVLLAYNSADIAAVKPLLERARLDAEDDDRLLFRVERGLVQYYTVELEYELAAHHARAALALAERLEDRGLRAKALSDVARAEYHLGHGFPSEPAQEAVDLERFCEPVPVSDLPTATYASILHGVDELDAARALYESLVDRARALGDEPSASGFLAQLSKIECDLGAYELAAQHARDAYNLACQAESGFRRVRALARIARVDAHRGRLDEARDTAERAVKLAEGYELSIQLAVAYALTFIELSLGNNDAVVIHAAPLVRSALDSGEVDQILIPSLIEALVALGDLEHASSLTTELEREARRTNRPRPHANARRSRALIAAARADLGEAQALLEGALSDHERLPVPFERARTLLILGVVQRRAKRRRAARTSLEEALAVFGELGARLWAERARTELARIGGRSSGNELTPTEAQVAARAAAGETNREIAEALYMSVKTVESNLSRVYRKLDISSRRQLGRKLEHQT
jgi:DNA-binding CsgD family transcriptional regulator